MEEKKIVANWWHYNPATRTLFYEIVENGQPCLKRLLCTLSAGESDNSWLAVPVPQLEAENTDVVLWEDKEFSPGKDSVVIVRNWEIRSNSKAFSLGIYIMFLYQLVWEWERDLENVSLFGHYSDGTNFEDILRLIIPFENGSAIAISTKNRRYFLQHQKIKDVCHIVKS